MATELEELINVGSQVTAPEYTSLRAPLGGRTISSSGISKDLMCVFLLSGMQKEDLDVSMLTKLQRHNVNIDDMNNEELIQACIESRDSNINIEKVKNTTGTKPLMSKLKNAEIDDYKTNEMLKRPRKLENLYYNKSADYKTSHEFNENNNKASKETVYENKPNGDEVTQYSDGRAKLESALKYLQDMKMNKAVKRAPIPQPVSTKEQESKRSITDDLHSSETETLSRMIANFLSKRKNMSTKPTTTQKTLNIEDLYETLYSMRKQDMEKSTNFKSGFQLPIQQNDRMTPVGKAIVVNESETKMDKNSQNRSHFTDALTLFNTYKRFNLLIPDDEIFSKLNGKAKESLKFASNENLNKFERSERVGATSTNIEPKHELSRDMIKEIADSVKQLILRDLRKELRETTTFITTTTIRTTTTQSTTTTGFTIKTTPKIVSTKPEESVMNKFLELFEEIKSLKRNTMVITNENVTGINNKESEGNVGIKELKLYPPMTMPARISNNIIQSKLPFYDNQVYRIQQYPTENPENIFNFAPQVHKYRSNGTFKKQEPKELNKGLLPITVQTNNIEVPPLGISLDKSQNLIRQNIIITTTVPYRIIPINNGPIKKRKQSLNQQRGTPHSEEGGSFKAYKSKQVLHPLFKESYKSPAHQFDSDSKDDVIRLTVNNNDNTKYNADYYEKIHIGKYKPRPDSAKIKHREIPRFHQKLEKVERYLDYPEQDNMYIDKNDCCNKKFRYSQAMVDCCNRKIASRQQMSFNNMKKKSYDDTHFKNFMQSQQKVTDMLEKILGDKRNVQSVETA